MSQRSSKATKGYRALRKARLTVAQENAIDALVTGKTDSETAAIVGVNRVTVTRWRVYNPHFQAALNERRTAIWAAGLDRLRSLFPLALDAIVGALTDADNPERLGTAMNLLKLMRPSLTPESGPTDPNEIVRRIVDERRENSRSSLEDIVDHNRGLPFYDDHVSQVWGELAEKLQSDDPGPSDIELA